MLLAFVLAQNSSSGISAVDPFVPYLNLGVIVVVLALAFTRKIRFEGEVKEKDLQIKELKDSLNRYILHYQDEVLPALIEVTKVSGEIVTYLNKRRD